MQRYDPNEHAKIPPKWEKNHCHRFKTENDSKTVFCIPVLHTFKKLSGIKNIKKKQKRPKIYFWRWKSQCLKWKIR